MNPHHMCAGANAHGALLARRAKPTCSQRAAWGLAGTRCSVATDCQGRASAYGSATTSSAPQLASARHPGTRGLPAAMRLGPRTPPPTPAAADQLRTPGTCSQVGAAGNTGVLVAMVGMFETARCSTRKRAPHPLDYPGLGTQTYQRTMGPRAAARMQVCCGSAASGQTSRGGA